MERKKGRNKKYLGDENYIYKELRNKKTGEIYLKPFRRECISGNPQGRPKISEEVLQKRVKLRKLICQLNGDELDKVFSLISEFKKPQE